MIVQGTLSTYTIRLRSVQNDPPEPLIFCYSADKKLQLWIIFQGESEEAGTARIDTFPAIPGLVRVLVFFPLSMFGNIHHLLQTEKPITLNANNNNDFTQVSFGTASDQLEPIGEEEFRGI